MGRRLYAYPYHLWTFLFTVVPLALIVYFAFTRCLRIPRKQKISGRTI